MEERKHVHLIGICGTAMASLAGMLKQRGMQITGSDAAAYPPMSDFLASLGITIAQPYSEANLKPRPDLVVVGNAISRGNPELEYVLDERIPMRSLPQILQEYFLRTRESLVVAGTHGKTTATSMLAWIFQTAGLSPSFLVGGIAENFGSSFAVKQGKHFIIEGDEYDTAFFDKGPKFLHYMPSELLLTHVEFDHADIYKDLDAVKVAFKRLVNLVPRRGKIIAFDASENVSECVQRAFCPVERYGLSEQANWRIRDLRFDPELTRWSLWRDGVLGPRFLSCRLAGGHRQRQTRIRRSQTVHLDAASRQSRQERGHLPRMDNGPALTAGNLDGGFRRTRRGGRFDRRPSRGRNRGIPRWTRRRARTRRRRCTAGQDTRRLAASGPAACWGRGVANRLRLWRLTRSDRSAPGAGNRHERSW